jgi:uncharacterized protein (TIGR03435 family)
MILRALFALLPFGEQMVDHLWQSTLFVVLAAMLAFVLRRDQARVRYWVWLTASVKFLIPFSLLIALGSHLAKPRASAPAQAIVSSAMDISQPFAGLEFPDVYQAAPSPATVSLFHLLPTVVVVVWLAGIGVVLFQWVIGWFRISRMVRKAVPIGEGPEVDALRHMEASMGVRRPIGLVLSRDWMEPGIFGIVRPVLIWPAGISQHLDDRHVEAILAHEVCHARRRDNLTAVLHMFVEAVFWFHPLVWWMGARLEEERERACDEEVSLLCNRPHVYAESILKVCKFCSESPLACVSGITGADLKKRIMQIMTERVVRKLDPVRKLLLLAVGLAVVAVPIVLGQVTAAQQFVVATIKPGQPPTDPRLGESRTDGGGPGGQFRMVNIPLKQWVEMGLSVPDYALKAPSWIDASRFDLEARLPNFDPRDRNAMSEMMKALLIERFGLKWHEETEIVSGYELVTDKKVLPKPGDPAKGGGYGYLRPGDPMKGRGTGTGPTGVDGSNQTMSEFVENLGKVLGRPIVDATHLSGKFDYRMAWRPVDADPSDANNNNLPGSVFTAVQEQLGLRLQSAKVPMRVVVVDNINRQPTAN